MLPPGFECRISGITYAAGSLARFISDRRERDAAVPTPSLLHLNWDGFWKAL